MNFKSRDWIIKGWFFLGLFLLLSSLSFADNLDQAAEYSLLTAGLPIEFEHTVDETVPNRNQHLGVVRQARVTFKSKQPAHIDSSGDKWFERFYFTEQVYVSEVSATRAFKNQLQRFTRGRTIAVKCPHYSTRVGDTIYSLETPCNFRWRIERLAENFKDNLLVSREKIPIEVFCEAGGACKTVSATLTEEDEISREQE